MSQKMKISTLIPHPKNADFFDDISGDAWTEFVESVKTSGVIEPIVVTQSKVIVSGHQRVRACVLLGIEEIDAEVKIFDSEDEILKCLIETNIRQRGIGNPNPVKFGRCIIELERIYGIQHGGDRKSKESSSNNFNLKSQEDLATEFGLTVQTLHNYKQLAESIPAIRTLVENGVVTPTAARAIIKKLPKEEQAALAKKLFNEYDKGATRKQVEEEIAKIKEEAEKTKAEELASMVAEVENLRGELDEKVKEIERLKNSSNEQTGNNGESHEEASENPDPTRKMTTREKFEFLRAERLTQEKEELDKKIKELNDRIEKMQEESSGGDSDSEESKELNRIKLQTVTNARTELTDFVSRYSSIIDTDDIRKLLKEALKNL